MAAGAYKMIECSIDCVSYMDKLAFSLACCTLPYDPPRALPRQEMSKMTIELSVYISVLFTAILRTGFSLQEASALHQTRVDSVKKFAIRSNAENTTKPSFAVV